MEAVVEVEAEEEHDHEGFACQAQECTPLCADCQQKNDQMRFLFISLNNLLAGCLPPSFYLIEFTPNTTARLFYPKQCFGIILSRMNAGFLFSNAYLSSISV